MPHGYHGKILVVNLSSGHIQIDEHDEAWYRTYMGGTNFGMYYILKHMPPGADALGPDNVLTLMLSVLTGAPFSGQSRMTANAKSPLTGAIGDAQAGGFFPAEMKNAGFDGVVFLGKAEKPVYLWLNNGQAELRDAAHLWGLGSWETETRIREELGDNKVEVACCGQAGENLVRTAAIINMRNRAAGRTGLGAVMGSKERHERHERTLNETDYELYETREKPGLARRSSGLFTEFPAGPVLPDRGGRCCQIG